MIHVIGLGVAERVQLSTEAKQAVQECAVVIGSPRQLETIRYYLESQIQHELPPLSQLGGLLGNYEDQSICLLASGDPLYYGIGRWLLQRYARDQLIFYPGISSIQAACHVVGLALQDVQVISLHGRPLLALRRHLARHRYIVALTDQYSHPIALAQECQAAGFTESRLWVCEKLGYTEQKVRQFSVAGLLENPGVDFDPLHVSVLEVRGTGGHLPAAPGIADDDFVTGDSGSRLLTKREVRMGILGLLQPAAYGVGWDIGAGCGGVTVEWALTQPHSTLYGIEHHPERLQWLAANRERFGVVDNLKIIEGRAPDCLSELPDPEQVFIGGSDGELAILLQYCWQRLPVGGVLVGSVVTEQNRQHYLHFADNTDAIEVETLQIAVSKGCKLAGQWVYRPKLPVTLFKFTKRNAGNMA